MQSTFLYAFSSLQRGVAPCNELPWLFTIAHNVCRTRKRSLRRRSRLEAGIDIDSLCETVGRDDPSRDDLENLGDALAALPENQRRALLLREWQGLSYAEVATRMGLTESAVEAVLFRARRSFAQKFRALDRVASLGALVAGSLRRLGSLAGMGKAAAATVAIGLAAGTALGPLVDSGRRAPLKPGRAIQVKRATPQHAMRPVVASRPHARHPTQISRDAVSRTSGAHPTRYWPGQEVATASAASAPSSAPAQPGSRPDEAVAPEVPAGASAATDTTSVADSPTPPTTTRPQADPSTVAGTANVLPPQVQSALPDVALPDPSVVTHQQPPGLPSPPQVDVPTVTAPSPPEAPSLPALPTTSLPLPNVTPPPSPLNSSPTQSTPLQVP